MSAEAASHRTTPTRRRRGAAATPGRRRRGDTRRRRGGDGSGRARPARRPRRTPAGGVADRCSRRRRTSPPSPEAPHAGGRRDARATPRCDAGACVGAGRLPPSTATTVAVEVFVDGRREAVAADATHLRGRRPRPAPLSGRPGRRVGAAGYTPPHAGNPLTDPNWAADLADTVERVVGTVRDRATTPVVHVTRGIVFGLLGAFLGVIALTLLLIGATRALQALLDLGRRNAAGRVPELPASSAESSASLER